MRSRYDLGVVYILLLRDYQNASEVFSTLTWIFMHISDRPSLTGSETSGSSFKNSDDTKRSAYSGQLLKKSNVQQFTSDGN